MQSHDVAGANPSGLLRFSEAVALQTAPTTPNPRKRKRLSTAAPGPIEGVALAQTEPQTATAPTAPNPKKRKRRGACYDKDKSKRVKAELLDAYLAGNNVACLMSCGRLREIAAYLAGSDPAELAANEADPESELFRSSYQNMAGNIWANEFRKAGTTARAGARKTGANHAAAEEPVVAAAPDAAAPTAAPAAADAAAEAPKPPSARGFAKFLVPLTSLPVHPSNIAPAEILCMARACGLKEEDLDTICMTRWFKSAMASEAAAVKLQALYRAFAARKRLYRSWHEAAAKIQAACCAFTARQVSAEPVVQPVVHAFVPSGWIAESDMNVSVYGIGTQDLGSLADNDMLFETVW